ncbi:hypothetical protein GC197_00175 [bacterium]|nr:hypothetical protein [bacterium]
MSFFQTTFLIATAAVAIPVLLHLLNRWQARQIELGTMRFLEEVVRDGAQRRKIRRWLLLLTRCVLVALLALLFARPYLLESRQQRGDRLRLVLVDRSASMGMKGNNGRLVDDALVAAAQWCDQHSSETTTQWAWFDSHVQPLKAEGKRPSAPQALSGDTNYAAALAWAQDRLHVDRDIQAEVVLVSDLQQSGLAGDTFAVEDITLPANVPVHLIDVGRPAANNLAITHIGTPSPRIGEQDALKFTVTLFNFGVLSFEEVPLSVALTSGERTAQMKKSINVGAGQAVDVVFEFGQLEIGVWRATATLDIEDDLAADNRRFAAAEIAAPIEVLVLDSGASAAGTGSESYFLATALEQDSRQPTASEPDQTAGKSPEGRFQAQVVYLQDTGIPAFDPQANQLVVVADAGNVSSGTIDRLSAYVRKGGQLLVFAGDASNADMWRSWEKSGLAPGKFAPPQRSGAMPFRIVSVAKGAMLRPFEDPQRGDLSRLRFEKILPVTTEQTTDVLASFDGQRPAVTKHPLEKGQVAWFLSSADVSWGGWTTSPLYLPLVQQMAADLVNLTGEGPIRMRAVGQEDTDGVLPAGKLTDGSVAPQLFERPGFQQQGSRLYVINTLAKESDPARLDKTTFANHFGLTLTDEASDEPGAAVEGQRRKELWPWFAAAVFLLMVLEFALANRTST